MSASTTSVQIKRFGHGSKQTLGDLSVLLGTKSIYECKTLELPWKNNAVRKSCIPPGTYQVIKRKSPKYGNHFHILNVPGRDYILIHQGNYYTQILGCVLVGSSHSDINGDGLRDVTNSVNTLKMLNSLLPDEFKLVIS